LVVVGAEPDQFLDQVDQGVELAVGDDLALPDREEQSLIWQGTRAGARALLLAEAPPITPPS
jgi:hypothetical protein